MEDLEPEAAGTGFNNIPSAHPAVIHGQLEKSFGINLWPCVSKDFFGHDVHPAKAKFTSNLDSNRKACQTVCMKPVTAKLILLMMIFLGATSWGAGESVASEDVRLYAVPRRDHPYRRIAVIRDTFQDYMAKHAQKEPVLSEKCRRQRFIEQQPYRYSIAFKDKAVGVLWRGFPTLWDPEGLAEAGKVYFFDIVSWDVYGRDSHPIYERGCTIWSMAWKWSSQTKR